MSLIIVIDPGHGGENEGGKTDNYTEKELTLKVAEAMKAQLEKYDDVKVYLTRDSDADVAIADRLSFANEVHADFYVSLHFNMSVEHDIYGFEVWLPSRSDLYNRAYPFAALIHEDYTSGTFDLFPRGIKTRLGNNGDYYGVIRHGTEYGIPAVIVEHAHMDQANDNWIIPPDNLDQSLYVLGVRDAENLAKAFHLTSTALGRDYSNLETPVGTASGIIAPDETPPEFCRISLLETNAEEETIRLLLEAEDKDSFITYYKISTDGGETWSELFGYSRTAWNHSEPSMEITLKVPADRDLDVIAVVMNSFDKASESNHLSVSAFGLPEPEETGEEEEAEEVSEAAGPEKDTESSETDEDETAVIASADEKTERSTGENSFPEAEKGASEGETGSVFRVPDLYQELDLSKTGELLDTASSNDLFYAGTFAAIALLFLILILTVFGVIIGRRAERRRRRKRAGTAGSGRAYDRRETVRPDKRMTSGRRNDATDWNDEDVGPDADDWL
ncbi:MAG: N-acetylmuramoyl-L-alanine amidase [Lachnospiraceae bacterium]|nr:N-acetylmuramoyl-L-alanine amidase [Lachnospiraceae bacterium]